ncbi:Cdc25 phosphatase Ibp1 [Coemansia sp. RSA 2611]|nr:Cdc25 phosphatase Ibp1 [Coemansia sp. RSA 2610]KAJ2390054.1 Cdc25 phosphatase Ibp1 [Coemansia sp. RSA 2611]
MTSFITAAELGKLVRDPKKKAGADYLVVDVRDSDYPVGHIPGALNVPAHEMYQRAGEIISNYSHVPVVVFHCMLSQQRGPKSARIYRDIVQERLRIAPADSPLLDQKIQVLDRGFAGWVDAFLESEPSLIEGFNQEEWDSL